jgi:hypothetical protein
MTILTEIDFTVLLINVVLLTATDDRCARW